MKRTVWWILAALGLVGGAAAFFWGRPVEAPYLAALRGASAQEAIALANRWREEGRPVQSYVTARAVEFVLPGDRRYRVPLPEDRMVVAVAPYIRTTHPCEVHYMSSCQGELANRPVQVRVTRVDGTVLVDQEMRTLPNGFLELWLPRGATYKVEVRLEGYRGVEVVETFAESRTCVTTLKLESDAA